MKFIRDILPWFNVLFSLVYLVLIFGTIRERNKLRALQDRIVNDFFKK